MTKKCLCAVLGFLLSVVSGTGSFFSDASAAGQTVVIAENEWNFVDDSVEVSHGIPEDASGALGQIERRGVLRVAVDAAHAPYTFTDPARTGDARYAGADLELVRLIAERMGVTLKIVQLESTQILPSLMEDQCDLAVSALEFTPARALSYTLSKGYYDPGEGKTIGVVISQKSGIAFLDDLEDRIITAPRNSLAEMFAAKYVTDYREFYRAPSVQAMFEAIRKGKAQAGFVNISTAEAYFQYQPDSGLMLAEGLSFAPDEQYLGYRVAAKKGETQLIAFVNGVIDEVLGNGKYEDWIREAGERAAELGL